MEDEQETDLTKLAEDALLSPAADVRSYQFYPLVTVQNRLSV